MSSQHRWNSFQVDDAHLVYEGPLSKLVRGVKLFSISSSAIALGMQPFVLSSAMTSAGVSTIGIVTAGLLATFTVTTPLLLHLLTRQYVTHLYWHAPSDPMTFTVVSYNIIARPKIMTFSRKEVVVPEVGGFLKSHEVRGRPLFIDSRMFRDEKAYVTLMSYDQPMDWELPSALPKDQSSSMSSEEQQSPNSVSRNK